MILFFTDRKIFFQKYVILISPTQAFEKLAKSKSISWHNTRHIHKKTQTWHSLSNFRLTQWLPAHLNFQESQCVNCVLWMCKTANNITFKTWHEFEEPSGQWHHPIRRLPSNVADVDCPVILKTCVLLIVSSILNGDPLWILQVFQMLVLGKSR